MDPALRHSSQTFNKAEVGALGKPFQMLNVSLLCPFQNHRCVWDLCPVGTPDCVQVTSNQLCPNISIFVSTDHTTFIQKTFGLSMWFSCRLELLSWSGHKPGFIMDNDAGVPAASSPWQAGATVVLQFLNILNNLFSSKEDSLGLLPELSKRVTHPSNLHIIVLNMQFRNSFKKTFS
ncbi:hypothetical protein ATANTOWER_016223 [Ataeniobius toweri]|uniref:Uncharacterized protein n=1 Tax=Ataeniobius toweri TaxID=208326 RepID=A0ABU7A7Z7_9TELE|nr:hypothetical protein [Ataeniobius toweri]